MGMSLKENSLKVLVISTRPPSYSGNLGGDVVSALESQGCDVDYLCRFPDDISSGKSYISIESSMSMDQNKGRIKKVISKLPFNNLLLKGFKTLNRLYYELRPHKRTFIQSAENDGIALHHFDESRPYMPTSELTRHIHGEYDFIVTMYWHRFINSTTLKDLYDHYKTPILIMCIDMAHITGGCQYFKNCRNFEHQCGCCPALDSKDPEDQTHTNFLIKSDNYHSIKCGLIANSWINAFAKKTGLFPEEHLFNISCVIDQDIYCPADKQAMRKELGIDKPVVLLIRSSKELRKGGYYALKALANCKKILAPEVLNSILIASIGDETISAELKKHDIDCVDFGFVNRDKLIKLYQASTYFLSPSVDDAGPSMVNQSMMCGTPVICFNNGTAIDVIQDKTDGFKTDEITPKGYTDILIEALKIANSPEYEVMCRMARKAAMKYNSKEAVGAAMIEAFHAIS